MIDKELPVVSKDEARKLSEEAMARFMAQGGSIERLKGRKNPKLQTANGKNKGGGKIMSDPTARFPKKD
jgi:ribosomal protein L19E